MEAKLQRFSCLLLLAATLVCVKTGHALILPTQTATAETEVNFLHDIPLYADDGLVNAVIEIPAGSNEKWEVTKDGAEIEWKVQDGAHRIVNYLPYPSNYGMFPQTKLIRSKGVDGDPLDVIVLGEAIERGEVVSVRVIGVMRIMDRGEKDDKLIAVLPDGLFADIDSLDELERKYYGAKQILATWFSSYKGKDVLSFEGWGSPREAQDQIRECHSDYTANMTP